MTDVSAAAFTAAFPFNYGHEVEFREIDMIGHVNNVRYADWAETIRSRYFEDVLHKEMGGPEGAIVARHEMDYLAQVRHREYVIVGGRITRFGTKSFDFTTHVWSKDRARLVLRSVCTMVAYDFVNQQSIAVPDAWRERAGLPLLLKGRA
jgi:acyl-CoA thioester hydrolase